MILVVVPGGIDLSIGSICALCNFIGILLIFTLKLHVLAALLVVVAGGGALAGAILLTAR